MLTDIKTAGRKPEAEEETRPGRVFWITGLSGAGKTTSGRELCSRLRAAGRPVSFLDGDSLRAAIAEDLDQSEPSAAIGDAQCARGATPAGERQSQPRGEGWCREAQLNFDGLMTKANTTPN